MFTAYRAKKPPLVIFYIHFLLFLLQLLSPHFYDCLEGKIKSLPEYRVLAIDGTGAEAQAQIQQMDTYPAFPGNRDANDRQFFEKYKFAYIEYFNYT